MINSLSRRGTSTAASRPTHPCVSSSRSASPNSSQHSIYCCPAEPLSLACSHTFAPAGCSTSSSSRSRSRSTVIARAANTADDDWDGYAADNFYQILGVPENASRRDIKRAYKAMMKDFHPDLSGDEESTEFCILLNDIYETLMDPDRRATYDALAGFSASSINPFADVSMPADQVFVDEYSCIGCRNCTNVCPKTFDIEDDFGRARVMQQGVDSDEKLQEAIDTCPVNCIHWVTASQLSLLEATMAKMERVAVWSLMSGGGSGQDVFTEASIAWEKRQAQVRAKVQQESDATAWNNWWANVAGGSAGANMYAQAQEATRRAASGSYSSGSYDGGDESSYSSYDGEEYNDSSSDFSGTKEGARIAKLAAKAARAARQWKAWQEMQQRNRRAGLLLTAVSSSGDAE